MVPIRRLPVVMLLLALIGIAVAFYDSYAIYNHQPLWCPPPIDGCNTVAESPYARVFGLPLGYFGLVFYVYMFCVAALLIYDPRGRGLRLGALLYATLGLGLSGVFFYIQANYIRAFCIYCLISAVATLLLFLAAARHFVVAR